MSHQRKTWWNEEEGEAHDALFENVEDIEQDQFEIFDSFVKWACLYDPRERMGLKNGDISGYAQVSDSNVCQSAADTISSFLAAGASKPTFQTKGAEWSMQRRARLMDQYCYGLMQKVGYFAKHSRMCQDGTILGGGLLKFWRDDKDIYVDRTLIDEMVADEREWRHGPGRNLYQRRWVDCSALVKKYDRLEGIEEAAEKARTFTGRNGSAWADYRTADDLDEILVIEGWRRPSFQGAGDGRHIYCFKGFTIVDEEWTKDYFPFVHYRHAERLTGFYGRGVVEQLAPRQRRINKMSSFVDRQHDLIATTRVYMHVADAALQAKMTNKIGLVVAYKNKPPVFHTPQAVNPESYARLERLERGGLEDAGVSQLTAQGKVPAGFESGAAIREHVDTDHARFTQQFKRADDCTKEAARQLVALAKELGEKAPKVPFRRRKQQEMIEWEDVDLEDFPFIIDIDTSSLLPQHPAGKQATIQDWAMMGLITPDEWRRLINHPDLERAMSLLTAAIEDIERTIEDLLDGEEVWPEPSQHLEMGIKRVQMARLKAKGDGAPDDILEAMDLWMTQAQHVLDMAAPPPTDQPMMPMDPMMAAAGMPPDPMTGAPVPVPPAGGPPLAIVP